MDYSTLPNDPDHPAGISPWSSSPQPNNRPSFQSRTSTDVPPSPLAAQSPYRPEPGLDSPQGYSNDQIGGRVRYGRPDSSGEGSVPEENGGSSPDLSARLQSPQLGEPGFIDQHQHQQQHQYAPQQRADGPQRYHTGVRAGQRQNVPQYKLQAKITSLERTGRKDPILRFDVHVRPLPCDLASGLHAVVVLTSVYRLTYPNSVLLNSATSAAHILNSLNLRTT